MGKVNKGVSCIVKGCGEGAVRSISYKKVVGSGLTVEKGTRGYLCNKHYKEYKKRTKKDRKIERLRFIG